ncbi:MAG: TIGR01459 family HAD-type hydrolase [Pseudomonadota bacterium]
MTQRLTSLFEVADRFEVIVLDQWGVLHNGSSPYPGAVGCLKKLSSAGIRLAVLSNSGKRARPNAERIHAMGFDRGVFEHVMTSGEALWQDIAEGRVKECRFAPIERAPNDAAQWAEGLDVTVAASVETAEAVLLMGLPDEAAPSDFERVLEVARTRNLPVFCTNPDRAAPRADGQVVLSPGALAHAYADTGGQVRFYGKPHRPVYDALEIALGTTSKRMAMVGDSLEHDVAGGRGAGWSTIFVEGGLHAAAFVEADPLSALSALAAQHDAPLPDYTISRLQ